MKVQDLLTGKNWPVHFIAGNRSVDDAVHLMAGENASALIVTENERPIGIFAERDVFRSYLRKKSTALSDLPLQTAMTAKLIVAEPEDDVSRVMSIMIKADIKHLPIMEEKQITRMLILNDLMEHWIESLDAEIHQLQDYIDDLHEAARD
jgi:CBS domain-containing protein